MPIGIATLLRNQLALASRPVILRAMTSRKPRTAAALAKRDRAKERHEAAIAELHEAIVDDLDDGFTQQELKDLVGVSRERIRLIAKEVRSRRAKQSG
jgi:hypothetical protein